MKYLVLILVFVSCLGHANGWTGNDTVKYIRTYDGDNYSIRLQDTICQNQKAYFYVTHPSDTDAFLSIALAAFMSGKEIRLEYTLDTSGTHCFVTGIEIGD